MYFTICMGNRFYKPKQIVMKLRRLLMLVIVSCFFISCSKEATDAANDDNVRAEEINGTWRETTTGVKIRISGVSSNSAGNAVITGCGSAFPASALGGTPMTVIEYQSGRYRDAYNNTFFPPSTWQQGSIIGLAMNESGSQFLIGSKVYVLQ